MWTAVVLAETNVTIHTKFTQTTNAFPATHPSSVHDVLIFTNNGSPPILRSSDHWQLADNVDAALRLQC